MTSTQRDSVEPRMPTVRMGNDAAIEVSGVQNLQAWHPSDRFNYVRITPLRVFLTSHSL